LRKAWKLPFRRETQCEHDFLDGRTSSTSRSEMEKKIQEGGLHPPLKTERSESPSIITRYPIFGHPTKGGNRLAITKSGDKDGRGREKRYLTGMEVSWQSGKRPLFPDEQWLTSRAVGNCTGWAEKGKPHGMTSDGTTERKTPAWKKGGHRRNRGWGNVS